MTRTAVISLCLTSLFLGSVATIPVVALGNPQVQREGRTIKTLEFENADVWEAINTILSPFKQPYEVNPRIQGRVTLSLKNVPLDVALEQVLRQVDAKASLKQGVMTFAPTEASEPAVVEGHFQRPEPAQDDQKPTSMVESGGFLYILRGNTLSKINKDKMEVTATIYVP